MKYGVPMFQAGDKIELAANSAKTGVVTVVAPVTYTHDGVSGISHFKCLVEWDDGAGIFSYDESDLMLRGLRQSIKELHERTAVDYRKCLDVLFETRGDVELAIKLLQERSLAERRARSGSDLLGW